MVVVWDFWSINSSFRNPPFFVVDWCSILSRHADALWSMPRSWSAVPFVNLLQFEVVWRSEKWEQHLYLKPLRLSKFSRSRRRWGFFCGFPYPKTPRTTGHSIENFEWLLFMVGTWLIRQEMKEMRVIWDQEQAGQDSNNPLTLRSK